ncbi:MAG: GNAT family N-acetyltransferase [bacterium]|nr:GNAT family N-acetyltransferase [bacterium]
MTEFIAINTPEEFDSLAELASEIWHEHFTSIIGEAQVEYMLEHFQSSAAMQEQVRNDGYSYYCVCDGGEVCGYCAICPHEDYMYLSKFYMRADFRRKGIGRKMMDFIAGETKKAGLPKIRLNVNKYNFAIDVYKRLGFSITADEVNDIGNGFVMDDYVMEKNV